jgi:hypothetical protein
VAALKDEGSNPEKRRANSSYVFEMSALGNNGGMKQETIIQYTQTPSVLRQVAMAKPKRCGDLDDQNSIFRRNR